MDDLVPLFASWNHTGFGFDHSVHLPVLDFLPEFTQHIPPKGSHLIRYYG